MKTLVAIAFAAVLGCASRPVTLVSACRGATVREFAVDPPIATGETFPVVSGYPTGNVLIHVVDPAGVPVTGICSYVAGAAFSQVFPVEEIERGTYLLCHVPAVDVQFLISNWTGGRPPARIPVPVAAGKAVVVWAVVDPEPLSLFGVIQRAPHRP